MGSFYTNYTLRGPSQEAVAAVLAGRSALVTPEQNGCVLVFDEESDEQNFEIIAELAARLSGKLHCPLLAVLNHDDDILWYQLYLNGELVDEYNSTPGYFNTMSEEEAMAGPEGGDAQKLCNAFGADAVARVESILRKQSPEDGYVFQIERHGDLVEALGISRFGVGNGFELISDEYSDDLKESDLVKTKDLVAPPPDDGVKQKIIPGYYKVSFRAHPKLMESIPTGWMPGIWADLECQENELSENFRKATATYREKFRDLGFTAQGYKKGRRILNPNSRDLGGINYLDGCRRHFGQLIYNRTYVPALETEQEKVLVAFTAVFPNGALSHTNETQTFLQPLPNHKVVRIASNDVAAIYQKFVAELKQRPEQPRRFPDLQSLRDWFDANAIELFEDRLRRGIFVRMSDYEVTMAQRKIPRPIPNKSAG